MTPRHRSIAIAAALLCGGALLNTAVSSRAVEAANQAGATADASAPTRPPFGLSGGARSIEALVDEVLAALERKDVQALNRLRLTKEEYVGIIVPGEVPKGQPPRQTYVEVNDVFWGMMDAKSHYTVESLVKRFGGRHFPKHDTVLTKGSEEFAWYTAHGEVRLWLHDEQGEKHELPTGWIAEVDGRFKFISFSRT